MTPGRGWLESVHRESRSSHAANPFATVSIWSGLTTRKAPGRRNGTSIEISNGLWRTAVVCGTTATTARSESPYSTLTTGTGRTLAVRGGILFLIQKCEQRAAGFSNFLVRYRTGIKRQLSRTPQDLYRESLLVAGRERLESVEEFDRLLAHIFKLAVFPREQRCCGCGEAKHACALGSMARISAAPCAIKNAINLRGPAGTILMECVTDPGSYVAHALVRAVSRLVSTPSKSDDNTGQVVDTSSELEVIRFAA
jgi:hypothetical protein